MEKKIKVPFKSLPCYDVDQIFRNWMISISGLHWTLWESHMDLYWVVLVIIIIIIELSSLSKTKIYMLVIPDNPDKMTAMITESKILRWGLMTLTTVGYDYIYWIISYHIISYQIIIISSKYWGGGWWPWQQLATITTLKLCLAKYSEVAVPSLGWDQSNCHFSFS